MPRLFKSPEQLLEEAVALLTLVSQGSDPIAQAGQAGEIKTYGTGELSAGLAGNTRLTIQNPANSGHVLILIGLATVSNVQGSGVLRNAPTGGLPATGARPAFNAVRTANALPPGVAVVKADVSTTTPLSGGTDTGLILGCSVGADEQILPSPIWIEPGQTLGWGAAFGAAFNVSANLTFIESPIV